MNYTQMSDDELYAAYKSDDAGFAVRAEIERRYPYRSRILGWIEHYEAKVLKDILVEVIEMEGCPHCGYSEGHMEGCELWQILS